MPARLKLELEIKAADMNVSSSQVAEAALLHYLEWVPLSDGRFTSEVVKSIPLDAGEPLKALLLYRINPNILDIKTRNLASLVWGSQELQDAGNAESGRETHIRTMETIKWAISQWRTLELVAEKYRIPKAGVSLKKEIDKLVSETDYAEDNRGKLKKAGGLF